MLENLLQAIVDDPLTEDRYFILADWLEECDDPRRPELLRLQRRLLATCCEPERHAKRAVWQARVVELLRQGVRPCVPQRTVKVGEKVELHFAFIPPGSFLMGSPPQEDGRMDNEVLHEVTLTRGFWMGIYPVTQAQWQAVTGRSFRGFRRKALPAQRVAWNACSDFCHQLGEGTDWQFRLPTEAEWEFACRCGTTTPFYYGETLSVDDANFNGAETFGRRSSGSDGEPTPVGNFPPNGFGMYDMVGNVWEWCSDLFGPYQGGESIDPRGADSGAERVLRGGSWYGGRVQCRSAYRWSSFPDSSGVCLGCRVVLFQDDQGS